jgi:prepilin-type N-terminal cleavage/methylation domain-containing protein
MNRAVRNRGRADEGFSLIEMLIAMFVVGVGLMALASVAITTVRTVRVSRERQDALQLASTVLEDARSFDYGRLALATADYDPTAPGNPSQYDGENIHAVVDGEVPHTYTDGPHSVTNWVTWANADHTAKRVISVVSWTDAGSSRTVTESTLVTDARRGLPVPNFQLSPEIDSRQGTQGQAICFDHTLTNLGEQDSYSWQLLRTDNNGNLVAAIPETRTVVENGVGVTRQGFKVPASSGPGQGWFAWMRMGPDSSTVQPMSDVTGDSRPDSAAPVPRRAQAAVTVCYTPKDSNGNIIPDVDDSATFTVRMYSAFDQSVVREVRDSLRVISDRQQFFLHHLYQNNGSPTTNHSYKLIMDPNVPTRTDPNVNFDATTGSNADSNPGLHLPPGQDVVWDYQNVETVSRTVQAVDADVRLSFGTLSSLYGNPVSPVTLSVRVEKFVRTNGNNITTTLIGSRSESVTPFAAGWTPIDWDVPIASSETVAPGEYLRLRVSCSSGVSNDDCHVAYDVAGYFESQLVVTLQ